MASPRPGPQPATRSQPSDAGTNALAACAAVLIGLLVAAPGLLAGAVLWPFVRGKRGWLLLTALGMLAGWGLLYLRHQALLVASSALLHALQDLRAQRLHWKDVPPIIAALWWQTWPAAPTVTLLIESLRPRTFAEQHARVRAAHLHRTQGVIAAAQRRARKAPEAERGQAVLGAVVAKGDARAFQHGPWAVYPADLLNRHAVVIGASGTGKTEYVLRLAYLARKVYGWRVFYLDAKGDATTAARFQAAMRQAGATRVAMFPEQPFDGWRGSPTELFNRLLAVEEFSEPYYRAMTKLQLSLACQAPGEAPRTSTELLRRLKLPELAACYGGRPELDDVLRIPDKEANGTYSRYRALFTALHGALDGNWAWEDVDAGYLLLDGLALKEEARSLGRYLLEDFGQAMVKRMPRPDRVLLIVDEFSALAGAAEAEALFERVRSPHGQGGAGIVITTQSYAALGAGADRMLQAAATTVAFQCADPERLVARAGVQPVYRSSVAGTLGRDQLAMRRTTGAMSLREDEAFKVHPDVVRGLPVGACVLLPTGSFQQVCVARLNLHADATQPVAPSAPVPAAAPLADVVRPVVWPIPRMESPSRASEPAPKASVASAETSSEGDEDQPEQPFATPTPPADGLKTLDF